jgi:hypothetical protein
MAFCSECKGNGYCQECGGKGWVNTGIFGALAMEGDPPDCENCGGDGKCPECGGSGEDE